MLVGNCDATLGRQSKCIHTLSYSTTNTPQSPRFFLGLSKTHFNLDHVESSQLVTQAQVLIVLWCNITRPLTPQPQTPLGPLHGADETKEVSNCFDFPEYRTPNKWKFRRPTRRIVFLMRLPPVYADGITEDSRLMALAFSQSILSASMLGGLWAQPVFNLAKKTGQ